MLFKRIFNILRVKAFHKNSLQEKTQRENDITTQTPGRYRKI